jgi:hypothetical protein
MWWYTYEGRELKGRFWVPARRVPGHERREARKRYGRKVMDLHTRRFLKPRLRTGLALNRGFVGKRGVRCDQPS